MLNRKASRFIFWGMLLAIAGVVFLVRVAMIGNIQAKTDDVIADSRRTQLLIDVVDDKVAANRDKQEETLYELYQKVPNIYDNTNLLFFVVAQMELAGITENPIVQREVFITEDLAFPDNSIYSQVQEDFRIMSVEVRFNVTELEIIDEFVDYMQNSEQIFIISEISYDSPGEDEPTRVEITFLTFYQK